MIPTTMTYQALSKGYVDLTLADVICLYARAPTMQVPYSSTQARKNMCCFKKLGQDLMQKNHVCHTVQMTEQKVLLNEIVSKNVQRHSPQDNKRRCQVCLKTSGRNFEQLL